MHKKKKEEGRQEAGKGTRQPSGLLAGRQIFFFRPQSAPLINGMTGKWNTTGTRELEIGKNASGIKSFSVGFPQKTKLSFIILTSTYTLMSDQELSH